jgi:6-phosphogluconolactonase
MNFLLPLATVATLGTAMATEIPFYLGTYTNKPGSKGIYLGRLDTDTGKLSPLTLAAEATNPSFLAFSPNGKFLYAAMESRDSTVGAFRVGDDGGLTALNTQPSGGADACHVWADSTGHNVLVANYGGGSIACFRTKSDGSLDGRTAFVQFTGSGPNPKRQTKPFGHCVCTDADSRFVYSCDLGTDNVWIFKFDSEKGTLTPAEPPAGKVPPGSGPRHLALHPNGRFAYVNNEMGLSVTAFARDTARGILTALQTLPTLPEGTPGEGATTAEIFCHPSGKWLYVSNRGHDSLTVYTIGDDGRLTWMENTPAQVKAPRSFAIDPSGHWMIVAGQSDNKIAVLKIDHATGRLEPTGQSAEVGAPACVVFAPAK